MPWCCRGFKLFETYATWWRFGGGGGGGWSKHGTSVGTELHWNCSKFTLATKVATKVAIKVQQKSQKKHICKRAFRCRCESHSFKSKGVFLWDDPDQDQWSKISRIMVHQRNCGIHSGQQFSSSFDLPSSEWSGSLILIRITAKEHTLKLDHTPDRACRPISHAYSQIWASKL